MKPVPATDAFSNINMRSISASAVEVNANTICDIGQMYPAPTCGPPMPSACRAAEEPWIPLTPHELASARVQAGIGSNGGRRQQVRQCQEAWYIGIVHQHLSAEAIHLVRPNGPQSRHRGRWHGAVAPLLFPWPAMSRPQPTRHRAARHPPLPPAAPTMPPQTGWKEQGRERCNCRRTDGSPMQ